MEGSPLGLGPPTARTSISSYAHCPVMWSALSSSSKAFKSFAFGSGRAIPQLHRRIATGNRVADAVEINLPRHHRLLRGADRRLFFGVAPEIFFQQRERPAAVHLIDGVVQQPELRFFGRELQLAHPALGLDRREVATVPVVGALEHRLGGEPLVPR